MNVRLARERRSAASKWGRALRSPAGMIFVLTFIAVATIGFVLLIVRENGSFLLGLAFWGTLVAIYLLPTIVAAARNHPNKGPILVINLFLGWCLIGWVVSLAWSVSAIPARGA
ncbi:MAG: superinfection immunity protein [Pirellulales bacterium]|nr:superinfection immunity protein [Pirellulales bacterium]